MDLKGSLHSKNDVEVEISQENNTMNNFLQTFDDNLGKVEEIKVELQSGILDKLAEDMALSRLTINISKIEVVYMSNIDPDVREKYSSVLCPNDDPTLTTDGPVKFTLCEEKPKVEEDPKKKKFVFIPLTLSLVDDKEISPSIYKQELNSNSYNLKINTQSDVIEIEKDNEQYVCYPKNVSRNEMDEKTSKDKQSPERTEDKQEHYRSMRNQATDEKDYNFTKMLPNTNNADHQENKDINQKSNINPKSQNEHIPQNAGSSVLRSSQNNINNHESSMEKPLVQAPKNKENESDYEYLAWLK